MARPWYGAVHHQHPLTNNLDVAILKDAFEELNASKSMLINTLKEYMEDKEELDNIIKFFLWEEAGRRYSDGKNYKSTYITFNVFSILDKRY